MLNAVRSLRSSQWRWTFAIRQRAPEIPYMVNWRAGAPGQERVCPTSCWTPSVPHCPARRSTLSAKATRIHRHLWGSECGQLCARHSRVQGSPTGRRCSPQRPMDVICARWGCPLSGSLVYGEPQFGRTRTTNFWRLRTFSKAFVSTNWWFRRWPIYLDFFSLYPIIPTCQKLG